MTRLPQPALRGVAIGLWVLTGLTFLEGALLPGGGQLHFLSPLLLAVSIVWTAVIPRLEQSAREKRPRVAFLLAGSILAFATSFVLIHDGDRRSLLLVGFSTLAAVLLASRVKRTKQQPDDRIEVQ